MSCPKYLPLLFFMAGALPPGVAYAQNADLNFLNHGMPVLDAHNCYPYEGRWADRIDRALKTGFPVAIEQDMAWYVDPSTGKGRAVLDHSPETNALDPAESQYFFDHIRPVMEAELRRGDPSAWPRIILHFDFKDQRRELLRSVWELLGRYEDWIVTARKGPDPHNLAKLDLKPLLVLTEDSDAQEKVFFDEVPMGSRLRLFGSARTHLPPGAGKEELVHLAATMKAPELLTEKPTNYRRWWNNSWYEVEEGGQTRAGEWTKANDRRLRELVDHAHRMGYWIRFYTLDGSTRSAGEANGWFASYNFGSPEAASIRWKAAIAAGVNLIATDQYEDLAKVMAESTRGGR